jgi:hypothetical protein
MARLQTVGFETQQISTSVGFAEAPSVSFSNTPVIVTGASARTGAAMSCAIATGRMMAIAGDDQGTVFSTARDYFLRVYFRYDAAPSTAVFILTAQTGGSRLGVKMETGGTLGLYDRNGSQVGLSSSVLSTGTYYRVEMKLNVPTSGNGTIGLRIDGTTVVADTAAVVGTAAPNPFEIGVPGSFTGTGMTALFDDIALNDGTGAAQNSYPGAGKVIHLLPVSDNARSSFFNGANGTTNLWDAVNNVPPVGVATGSKTSTSQNYATASSATYDPNVQDYTTGGVGGSDTISVVQAMAQFGGVDAITQNHIGGIQAISNPTISEVTGTATSGVPNDIGTSPTHWPIIRTAPSYAPVVTNGTQPVLRYRRADASGSQENHVDYMALVVDYAPAVVASTSDPAIRPGRAHRGLVMRHTRRSR